MVCYGIVSQCDGFSQDCDDGSDEEPGACDNCTRKSDWGGADLAMCRDGSMCFSTTGRCGFNNVLSLDCADGSDESDTYSNCDYCTEEESVPCPGFPGNCGKLCDGRPTCPDKWDELLSTCKSRSGEGQSDEADDASVVRRLACSSAKMAPCA